MTLKCIVKTQHIREKHQGDLSYSQYHHATYWPITETQTKHQLISLLKVCFNQFAKLENSRVSRLKAVNTRNIFFVAV